MNDAGDLWLISIPLLHLLAWNSICDVFISWQDQGHEASWATAWQPGSAYRSHQKHCQWITLQCQHQRSRRRCGLVGAAGRQTLEKLFATCRKCKCKREKSADANNTQRTHQHNESTKKLFYLQPFMRDKALLRFHMYWAQVYVVIISTSVCWCWGCLGRLFFNTQQLLYWQT